MAFIQVQELPWNKGEIAMQEAMRAPHNDNPTVPELSPQLANHLQIAPLVAIGTLDAQDRPWTTLWGGEPSLGQPVARGIIGLRTSVTGKHDPAVEALFGKDADGQVVREEGRGRMVSGLTLDLVRRKRVKFFGRMIAGALSTCTEDDQARVEAQLVLKIEQSLGNCPKYINQRRIKPAAADPTLVSDSALLPQQALDLISKADIFFISSSGDDDMDTNHRGGPPGFVRCVPGAESVLIWPEYSGNRLYQTLGNLKINPLAGISIPDFETGDMLYMTGTTEIIVGSSVLPKTNLAVKFTVAAARLVAHALPFSGEAAEFSPYNPTVRYLNTERSQVEISGTTTHATLVRQETITPTISRYTFTTDRPVSYRSGQYVTFDFSSLLDLGYSHMRDDDPRSLNDDFVRTFTVTSAPAEDTKEFEITTRQVGVVTNYMAGYRGTEHEDRRRLDVDVKGFGGEFEVSQKGTEDICFIAAGVGITPILSALPQLDMTHLHLLWSARTSDVPFVRDIISRHPSLAPQTSLFITGSDAGAEVDILQDLHVKKCVARRMYVQDLDLLASMKVYLCTSTPLRKAIIAWLPHTKLLYEDFNF